MFYEKYMSDEIGNVRCKCTLHRRKGTIIVHIYVCGIHVNCIIPRSGNCSVGPVLGNRNIRAGTLPKEWSIKILEGEYMHLSNLI